MLNRHSTTYSGERVHLNAKIVNIEEINSIQLISKILIPPKMAAKIKQFWLSVKEGVTTINPINNFRRFMRYCYVRFFTLMNLYDSVLNAKEVIKQFVVKAENGFYLSFIEQWRNYAFFEKLEREFEIIKMIGKVITFRKR